jgi:hypothetical protein
VATIGETKNASEFLWGNFLENDHLEHQEGDGKITLRWILGRHVDLTGLGTCAMVGFDISSVEP